MPSPKRKIGDVGEDVVCAYLTKHGYTVLERNYWKPWGEIDVVAKKANIISFIEVKSVSRLGAVRPEENMHPSKIRKLHRAIQTYLLDRKIGEDQPWKIDLACVFLDFSAGKAKVELIENIVL